MIIPLPSDIRPAEELGGVHLVGIGGAALSGIARLMRGRGVAVTGCDAADSPALASLRDLGIDCFAGHDAAHLDGVDTVVVSTAVGEDNPEVAAARVSGLRLWPRAAAVQSLLLGHRAVVVTGTHGKTTTTSMLVTALLACGADPSYAIGSTLVSSGLNAAVGSDDLFVTEGDESDAAILAYRPVGAVVTNVDADHLDVFGTPEAYAEVFDRFLERIEPGGFCVCGVDDAGGRRLAGLSQARRLRTVTVGEHRSASLRAVDIEASDGGSSCTVWDSGVAVGRLTLGVPGPSYVVDALAALAAGLELGYPLPGLLDGLGEYRGSGRRMEYKGVASGVRVYDSYAHHPAEITADLRAARQLAGSGRLVVAFQPHLFSRTRLFGAEMGAALGAADVVVVLDVYPAREAPVSGVTGALVAEAVPLPASSVSFEPDREAVVERLAGAARPGDLVLTLGAGDVTELGPGVLARLAEGPGGPADARQAHGTEEER